MSGYLAKEIIGNATLYLGDCMDMLPMLDKVDAVITDPPYPNRAGHFDSGISAASNFIAAYKTDQWMIFWDEITSPPCSLPLVAKHIWHRTNTNRPDNYEVINHYHQDGRKRASRVLPFAVIAVGLTGCTEATGHPTQKNVKLMDRLVTISKADFVLDPFMGSGTTGVACINLGRQFIGIEKERKYFDIACERIQMAQAQGRLF